MGVIMKKLFGVFVIIVVVSAFNICAMERGENVAPVMLTQEEMNRRLRQQREELQQQARRLRRQEREAGQYRGLQRNLNAQFGEHAENAGDMDVEF